VRTANPNEKQLIAFSLSAGFLMLNLAGFVDAEGNALGRPVGVAVDRAERSACR
jgi:hypothetical protein